MVFLMTIILKETECEKCCNGNTQNNQNGICFEIVG